MANSKNIASRLIEGSTLVLLFAISTSVFSYFLRILYSRSLSIEMYGLFYALLTLAGTIILYCDFGFSYSTSYLIPKYLKKHDYQTSWNIYKYSQYLGVGVSLILSILLALAAPFLAEYYFKASQAQNLIYIFCIFLMANSFVNTQHALFIGMQQEKYYSSIQLIRVIITIFLSGLTWILIGPDIYLFAAVAAFSYVSCGFIFNYLLHRQNTNFKTLSVSWDKKLFKEMYVYAIPALLANSIYSLIVFSDTFFLTLFKGVKEVGIYNIAIPLAFIPLIVLSPLANFFLPLVSHLENKEKGKISYLLESILKFVPFTALYFALFICLFPKAPVILLFGQKWSGLVENPLSILALGNIGATMTFFFSTIVMGLGKMKQRLNAFIFIALFSIVLNACFVFYLGVIGATIASAIVQIISIIILGMIIKKVVPFNYPFFFYLKLLIFSVILFFIAKFLTLDPEGWVRYITAGIIYSLIFFTFGVYLKIINKDLLKMIFNKNFLFNKQVKNVSRDQNTL